MDTLILECYKCKAALNHPVKLQSPMQVTDTIKIISQVKCESCKAINYYTESLPEPLNLPQEKHVKYGYGQNIDERTHYIKTIITKELWNQAKACALLKKQKLREWLGEAIQEKIDREVTIK